MTNEYKHYLNHVIAIAKQAGQEILAFYKKDGDIKFKLKADDSPLTEADLVAHDIISTGLNDLTPEVSILSEEGEHIPYAQRGKWERYWLIDPLDGTNEFINHTGNFTVNIALIENNQSVLGVSYAPEKQTCYFACRGGKAFREGANGQIDILHTRAVPTEQLKVIVSKKIGIDKLQTFLSKLAKHELIYLGGSLKLCLVAEGEVDIYPRLGFNCEWDTAAGQCIVEQAGGLVVDLKFNSMRYNTKDSLYNPYFLVLGDRNYNWQQYLQFLQQR